MAEVIAVLTTVGTQLMTAASTAGSFAVANAGTIATGLSAAGTIYGGLHANAESKVASASMKKKGDNEFSAAQREAIARRRQTELVLSRQKTVAAASGAGATDPTVEAIMGKTQQEGDYNAMMDMYNGATNRADLYSEAATTRREGKNSMWGSFVDAGTTIYGNISKKKPTGDNYVY